MRALSSPLLLALLATCAGGAALAAVPPAAPSSPPPNATLRGRALVIPAAAVGGAEELLDLGCDGVAVVQLGARVHVACGADGAVEVALGPPAAVVGRRAFEGAVTGFFVVDGDVWVRLARVEARPLVTATAVPTTSGPTLVFGPGGSPDAAAPAVAPAAVAAPRLPVLERHAGRVIIGADAPLGLARGQHIELFVEHPVDLGGGATGTREERIAVGIIVASGEGRAEVELGLGERVPDGALARTTAAPRTASKYTSPRLPDLWELRFAFRPFLALGTVGFGMVDDLRATYRFKAPVALHAMLDPAGVGIADDGNILALAGNVVATYDSALFEVGLGLGWSAVNGDLGFSSYDSAGSNSGSYAFKRVKDGFSLAQLARLGAVDGFNLVIFNNFLLYDGEFNYGGTRATLQVPVTERLWFIAGGGGGSAGYIYGEIGLRVLVAGNGDHGTVLLTPSVGAAGLFGESEYSCDAASGTCVRDIEYAGPMVGIALEYRP